MLQDMVAFFEKQQWNHQVIKKYMNALFKNYSKVDFQEFYAEVIHQYCLLF